MRNMIKEAAKHTRRTMALLLVMATLLPALGMARPVMAAEAGTETEAATETDAAVTEAAEPYGPQIETAEPDGSQEPETPIVTAFTTYAEPQDAKDAQASAQKGDTAASGGTTGFLAGVKKARRAAQAVEDDYDVSGKWSWSVQWKNEADPYDMGTKTASFTPMYQVNFHSDLDTLRPGQVVIRMPASLYELTDEDGRTQGNRSGELVLPSQVAVPKGTYVEGEAGTFTESNVSPFNYDIVDNDHGSKDIVFWNYKDVPSGTTAGWQVVYPTQLGSYYDKSVIDGSKIELTPSISIPDWTLTEVTQDADGNNVETVVRTGSISATGTPLTGLVDTYVEFIVSDRVDCNVLVTRASLGTVPEEYLGNNFKNYYYVKWMYGCSTRGNQPGDVSRPVDSYAVDDNGQTVQGIEISSGYDGRDQKYYHIHAYPKEGLTGLPTCHATVSATCHPRDGLDPDIEKTITGSVKIPETELSQWTYTGDYVRVSKNYKNSLPGSMWQLRYDSNKSKGVDVSLMEYSVNGYLRGYGFTHDVNSEDLGPNEYKGGSFTLMTADDVLYAWSDKDTNNKMMLTADDYYMSGVYVETDIYGYEVYEPDNGGAAGRSEYPDLADYADRDLVIQAMFSGEGEDLDKWVDVARVPWENAAPRSNGNDRYYSISYSLTSADIARRPYRVRAIQSCVDYQVHVCISPTITIKHDSPVFAKLMDDKAGITVENLAAALGVANSYNGDRLVLANKWFKYSSYTQADGYQTELSAITEQLYSGDGDVYGDGWEYEAPAREQYSCTAPYTSWDDLKQATTDQSVSCSNNTSAGRIDLTYSVGSTEGFVVSVRTDFDCIRQFAQFPDRTEVKIYDLLPVNVHFDSEAAPVVIDIAYLYRGHSIIDACEPHSVEVTDIVANYNGTGRELVEFTIACPNGLPTVKHEDSYWNFYAFFKAIGVRFNAYIAWDDIESSKIGPNIAAWIPSDGGPIVGKDKEASLDDGTVTPGVGMNPARRWTPYSKSDFTGPDGLSLLGSDINKDGITDTRSVLYSSSTATTNYAIAYEAGIDKKVRADAGGVATNAIQIKPGEDYTYDLIIKSRDNTSVKDVTVFDQIENVETNHWQGIFRGVGYDDAIAHGATDVTVWYSADRDAPMPDNKVASSLVAENILTAANGWTKASEWEAPLADVKAVAMQLGGMDIGKEQFVTVQIHMTAPDQESFEDGTSAYGTAWNRAHMLATIQGYAGATAQTGMHDSRDVSVAVLPERPYLYLTKTLEGVPEGVDASNDMFTFQVKLYDKKAKAFIPAADREYWIVDAVHLDGDVPEKLETGQTDAEGSVTFKAGQVVAFQADYPHQRFEVTEPDPGAGWRCAENEATGWVDDYGTEVSITNIWNRLTVTKNMAGEGTTNDAAQAFDMADGTYGFKLVDGEYVSNNKGKHSTTATSTWTAKYDMDNVSFKYSYSSEDKYDKFTLTVAGKTIANAASGATTVKAWSGTLKKGDTIVMKYTKDSSDNKNDDQCKIYDILVLNPVDTEDDTEFTFELKDADGNPVADAPLVIGSDTGVTDGEGRFHLKAGQTASITVATGDYTVTEVPTFGYKQVAPANGEAAHVAVTATGSNAVEFLNAVEDMGFRLPKTGGTGVMPVYGVGGMLALCGCAALVGIRKRKDGDMD